MVNLVKSTIAQSQAKWNELMHHRSTSTTEGTGSTEPKASHVPESLQKQFRTCAFSITNATSIPLNVSLNQIGPLMYEVVPPSAVFERRTMKTYFTIRIAPWYGPQTEYQGWWDVTWPIALSIGPIVAGISILAVPFAALAAGGTALASLTGIGSTLMAGASSSAATATKVVSSASIYLARASHIPFVGKRVNDLRSKLTDAAMKNVQEVKSVLQSKAVRYLIKPSGEIAPLTMAAADGTLTPQQQAQLESEQLKKEGQRKKLGEVNVTGFELTEVLKCNTGVKKTDEALKKLFDKLVLNDFGWKASENPVVRICGGPYLEETSHTLSSHRKMMLIFKPFYIERVEGVAIEPLPDDQLDELARQKESIEPKVASNEEVPQVASTSSK